MLKMIIVDDERSIRESIHKSVQWGSLGISIVGLAKNAQEAYDMILDECPDIVLTDIRMPGFSGLELIARTAQAHPQTHFIVLSGYGEFEYAKEAMKWGVKHYLLKPCSPGQLIEVLMQVKSDCFRSRLMVDMQSKQRSLMGSVRQGMLCGLLVDALSGHSSLEDSIEKCMPYLDFDNSDYECYRVSGLPAEEMEAFVNRLRLYQQRAVPAVVLHAWYGGETLVLCFETYAEEYADFERQIGQAHEGGLSWKRSTFASLRALLEETLPELSGYETIRVMNGEHSITLNNYAAMFDRVRRLFEAVRQPSSLQQKEEVGRLIGAVSNESFRELLVCNALMHDVALPDELLSSIDDALPVKARERRTPVDNLIALVHENIGNPALSLKWLAENRLYMNVDYLSKQFVRQTGEKFSAFLNRTRIDYARELLSRGGESVNSVAEKVGLGNNPQYFSQLFRRATQMTPREYAEQERLRRERTPDM